MFSSMLGEILALLVLTGFVTTILMFGARRDDAQLRRDLEHASTRS